MATTLRGTGARRSPPTPAGGRATSSSRPSSASRSASCSGPGTCGGAVPIEALFGFAPPLKDLAYAVWLVPAVLAPLIIRKPGAALFAEMVAAGVSAILGSQWGVDTLLSGFVQGAAAELIFAFTLYQSWSYLVLALAASPARRPPGSTTGRSTTPTSTWESSWSAAC